MYSNVPWDACHLALDAKPRRRGSPDMGAIERSTGKDSRLVGLGRVAKGIWGWIDGMPSRIT